MIGSIVDSNNGETLRELIEVRIGAFEKMVAREFTYVKEAMERVADQSAPIATVQEMMGRIGRVEKAFDKEIGEIKKSLEKLMAGQRRSDSKIKILWWVGSIVTGALIAIVTSLIKSWLGV
jgi:hypothetical protein